MDALQTVNATCTSIAHGIANFFIPNRTCEAPQASPSKWKYFLEDAPRPTQTIFSNLTRWDFYWMGKVEIYHPKRGWMTVNKADIQFLHQRKLQDEHVTKMFEADIEIKEMVACAKNFPSEKGEDLMEIILSIGVSEDKNPPEKTLKSSRSEKQPSVTAPQEIVTINFWDGKMLDVGSGKLGRPSQIDLHFFYYKGLTIEHLTALTRNKISLQEIFGMIGLHPTLRGDDLYEKITAYFKPIPEIDSFTEWEKNPFGSCSRGPLLSNDYKKALVVMSIWENRTLGHSLQFEDNRQAFKKLHQVYNLCMDAVQDSQSFCEAIEGRSLGGRISLLYILAQGDDQHIRLNDDEVISTDTMLNELHPDCFSGLAAKARIIFTHFEAGKGRDNAKNIVNHFSGQIKHEAVLYGSEMKHHKTQFTLWIDENGRSIIPRIWTMKFNQMGVQRAPREMTYVVESSEGG